jgi:hypothetical protein
MPPVPLHLWHDLILAVLGTPTSRTSSLNTCVGASSISHGMGGSPWPWPWLIPSSPNMSTPIRMGVYVHDVSRRSQYV